MDLKNYEVQPDSGLFEKIERRLRMRRMARVCGGVAAAVVAVAAVVWVAMPSEKAAVAVAPEAVAVARVQETPVPETIEPVAEERQAVSRPTPLPASAAVAQEVAPAAAVVPEKSVAVAKAAQPVVAAKPADPVRAGAAVRPVPAVAEAKPAAEPVAVGSEAAAGQAVAQEAPAAKGKDPSSSVVHEDNLLWAPNAIVPNGEVDENRTFKLKFSSEVTDFRITIFNRGGRQLYQSTDPQFLWDGTYDGAALPQGAYVWVAKFRDSDGRVHQEKGTVTIIR